MPSKFTIKEYVVDGYYHVYNRGVEKRTIFADEKDYTVFLRFLKEYLLPPDHPDLKKLKDIQMRRSPINCFDDISLLAFSLMPNHFHLFIKQKSEFGLIRFMKALMTNYVMYFNLRYNRVGPLFQGIYKAVRIDEEPYFLHLSRYLHLNPRHLLARDEPLHTYSYSSYPYYLGIKKADWLNVNEVLSFFETPKFPHPKGITDYQSFVEEYIYDEKEMLAELTLEEEEE